MKNFVSIWLIALFSSSVVFFQCAGQKSQKTGKITLSGAWALYPMAVKWAEEYQKINPDVRFDISAGGAGKGMTDCLAEVVDIGMVSREIQPGEIDKGAWRVSVTKDAVVPTVSAVNPVIGDILAKGVRRETLVGVWIDGTVKEWGPIIGSSNTDAIHVYTRSDACGAAQTWAEYLGAKQEDLRNVGVYGDPGLAEAVRSDALGIGFNNINYVYDAQTKRQVDGIRVLPIDLNANGALDADENFYTTRDEIVQAIAAGKYPSPPARNLHFVCHGEPKNATVLRFLKWVLTDGQAFIDEAGYIQLPPEKIAEELQKLQDGE